jgi:chemotaxis protein MotB
MGHRFRTLFLFVAGMSALLAVPGCSSVSEADYNALAARERQQQQQLAAGAAERERLQQQLAASQQELAEARQQVAAGQARIADDQMQIQRLRGAIRYTINSDLLFTSGSWQMSPSGEQIIAKMASQLAADQRLKLVVNGFTDNAPISGELRRQGIASNQELSQKRAESVMQFMIAQGVKPELVMAQGFGEENPIAPNTTPQGRAHNRRVEITVAGT